MNKIIKYYVFNPEMTALLVMVVKNTHLIGFITFMFGMCRPRNFKLKNKDNPKIVFYSTIIKIMSLVGIAVIIINMYFVFRISH